MVLNDVEIWRKRLLFGLKYMSYHEKTVLELYSVHISYDILRQNLLTNSLIETYIKNDIKTLLELLTRIGFFDFEELHFEAYEGKGGHLPGEVVLIDNAKKIAIRGLCRKMVNNIEKLKHIWYNSMWVYVTFENVIYLRGNDYGNKVWKEKI